MLTLPCTCVPHAAVATANKLSGAGPHRRTTVNPVWCRPARRQFRARYSIDHETSSRPRTCHASRAACCTCHVPRRTVEPECVPPTNLACLLRSSEPRGADVTCLAAAAAAGSAGERDHQWTAGDTANRHPIDRCRPLCSSNVRAVSELCPNGAAADA